MNYLKKNNLIKQIFFSKTFALILALMVLFTCYGLFSIIGKSMDAAKERKISEAEAAQLKKKETDVSVKLTQLKTPEGQETALREQFPVVSQGESVVVITNDAGTDNDKNNQSSTSTSNGFWNFLKGLVK